jgi:hypothetical protein
MAKLIWKILNVSQANNDITTYVQSINLTIGRPTALSPYSGNSASVTMLSYGGTESLVSVNDELLLQINGGGSDQDLFKGRIMSRNFNDNPGTGINSTMTVMINDSMLQAGQSNMRNQFLFDPNNQIEEIDDLFPLIFISADGTDVLMSTGEFTTNANQRINEIIAGDRGILFSAGGVSYYHTPVFFNDYTSEALTIGSTTSATQIAYQTLTRVEASSNSLFYTQATVTGSASTETKTADVGAFFYGVKSFTVSTAQSEKVSETAEWYSNTFADPEVVMLNMTVVDYGQNDTALIELATYMAYDQFVEVTYTPPGETAVTGYFFPEQMTVNATTSGTNVEFLMSPLTYYANFILDDAVFGVLDTDRLGV